MTSKYWLKLYHEILSDPKMGTMSDRLFRRTIEVFLLAGKMNLDGALPTVEDMGWYLHRETDELTRDLEALHALDIVRPDGDLWIVTNFEKRQAPSPHAERMRDYRSREKVIQHYKQRWDETFPQRSPNAVVNSSVSTEVNGSVTDELPDTDTDTDKRGSELENFFGPRATPVPTFAEVSEAMLADREWLALLHDYPSDVQGILIEVCQVFALRPPERKKDKAYWIERARALQEACGEFGLSVLDAIHQDTINQHLTIEGPGSLVKMARAKAAEFRQPGRSDSSAPVITDWVE